MVVVIWMDALTGEKSWRKHADLVSLDGGGDLIERKVVPFIAVGVAVIVSTMVLSEEQTLSQ